MQLQTGQVFRLHCQTCATPKMKYFVVAMLNPFRCFVINSKPTALQLSRPDMMNALARIMEVQHRFLHHDSYVGCGDLFAEHSEAEVLAEYARNPSCYIGDLHGAARKAVARSLDGNRLLPVKYIAKMLQDWP